MKIQRDFPQNEIADLLDDALEVDSAPWRHGRKVTFVFSEKEGETPGSDGAVGPFWRCTIDVHHEEGWQIYGPVTCTRVEPKPVTSVAWVAVSVDAAEKGAAQ